MQMHSNRPSTGFVRSTICQTSNLIGLSSMDQKRSIVAQAPSIDVLDPFDPGVRRHEERQIGPQIGRRKVDVDAASGIDSEKADVAVAGFQRANDVRRGGVLDQQEVALQRFSKASGEFYAEADQCICPSVLRVEE